MINCAKNQVQVDLDMYVRVTLRGGGRAICNSGMSESHLGVIVVVGVPYATVALLCHTSWCGGGCAICNNSMSESHLGVIVVVGVPYATVALLCHS